MLKIVLISLFMMMNTVRAESEPQGLFIVSNGKVIEIEFSKLKRKEVFAVNHHPNFHKQGKIKYSGHLVRDVLKGIRLKDQDLVTVVGKTGQFSIELFGKELLEGDNLIATHVNDVPVKTSENGLQIIYSEAAIQKFPHLKQRQYWCWWVRSFILDDKFTPKTGISTTETKTLKTKLPWPAPYGISSKGDLLLVKERKGVFLSGFKKLHLKLLNGTAQDIAFSDKVKYFLAEPIGNKEGAYSLHQVVENGGFVETFAANTYYIKSLEVFE